DAADAGGLVRRVLDRQAQNFAVVSGGMTSLQQTGDLLAPEVMAIEFSYWDGFVWQIEWNSDELGELPLAIKIQMQMSSDPSTATSSSATSDGTFRTFEHIIRLPMARIIEEESEDTSMEGV
ncbi:MAG: prepilin-type cleavage/methylation domain-containing protein, partial [Planctomycetota bacterium]